ncbi:MAG: four helix bundle protein [Bacteroidales bacterium]
MALFTELPVYKLGYDLLIEIYERTKTLNREYKYTIGERLKNEVFELLINIYKANKSKKTTRLDYIEEARQHLEIIRLLLRVLRDLRIIGVKGFVFIDVKVEELSKQLTSWYKYTAGAHAKETKND